MSNTTKLQLAMQAAKITGMPQTQCRRVMDAFLDVLQEELCSGNTIELRGFGRFSTPLRASRPARNPHTGEYVRLPSRRTAVLHFSSEILAALAREPQPAVREFAVSAS